MEKKEVEIPTTTQKLQNKVDKLKLLSLTSGIHNLTPPPQKQDDGTRDIALVKALSVTPRVAEKFIEIRGMEYDLKTKQYVQVTEPIMNTLGAYRFCKILKMAQEIEWSSYSEDEINLRIIHFFEENIPYFLFWSEDYNLNPRDFNYIISVLQYFIDTSFHKAKSGKFINTLARTYGEDVLKRALDVGGGGTKREEGILAKYNPFKTRK